MIELVRRQRQRLTSEYCRRRRSYEKCILSLWEISGSWDRFSPRRQEERNEEPKNPKLKRVKSVPDIVTLKP